MFESVSIGTNNLEKAGEFYDELLAVIGMVRLVTEEREFGYGLEGGLVNFWILKPFDGEPATTGNGVQISFQASGQAGVDAFHAKALALGGSDTGKPGPRDYTAHYYGAYVRDRDGNKLHVMFDSPG